jgi:tetratricopeptide (TPR) repeat protein
MAAWLYRPLLDLGKMPAWPTLGTNAIEFAYRRMVEDVELPQLMVFHTAELRAELVRAIGQPEYMVEDPRQLAEELRTHRWRVLCEQLERLDELPERRRLRVIETLQRLGMLTLALELLDRQDLGSDEQDHFDLRLSRALTRYLLRSDDRSAPYSLSEFEEIAEHAPPGIAKLTACYQMVRQPARESADLVALETWQPHHLAALEELRGVLSDFDYQRFLSRYHRVGAFIPQMKRDGDGTIVEMVKAESLARSLPRDSWEHRVAADDALYAALESRSKEARWLGEGERALAHARELAQLMPVMSDAWFHQGDVLFELDRIPEARDAYRRALRYCPPGAARALYSIGLCEEILGDPNAAADSYIAAMERDPLAIGAAKQLARISEGFDTDCCFAYAQHVLEELGLLKDVPQQANMGTAHRHVPPPLAATPRRA